MIPLRMAASSAIAAGPSPPVPQPSRQRLWRVVSQPEPASSSRGLSGLRRLVELQDRDESQRVTRSRGGLIVCYSAPVIKSALAARQAQTHAGTKLFVGI